jgi:uncharacterized membrane protein
MAMVRRFLSRFLLCLFALTAGVHAFAQAGPGRTPEDPDSIWRRLTPEQRESLWRQMTPEQKGEAWRRLTPEQRQAIRQNLTPEQRETLRQRWQEARERRDGAAPGGRRLSPEERRQLRDQIYESNRARPPHGGRNGR